MENLTPNLQSFSAALSANFILAATCCSITSRSSFVLLIHRLIVKRV